MTERDWLIPSFLLTALLGVVASLLHISSLIGTPDLLFPIWGWGMFAIVLSIIWAGVSLVLLAVRKEPSPLTALKAEVIPQIPRLPVFVLGTSLASLDLYFYMWLKPQINAIRPFWADHMFASIGHFVFGQDPWRYLTFLLHDWVGYMYTPIWFTAIIVCFYWLLLKAPSERRSRLMVTYFLLWSVFGPLGQYYFASGGPIFYQRIYGDPRYAELMAQLPNVTKVTADYLWQAYQDKVLAYGAGISAMPSLHVATVSWAAMVAHREPTPLRLCGYAFALFIIIASVALGWHFAMDDAMALAGTALCYAASRPIVRLFASRPSPLGQAALAS